MKKIHIKIGKYEILLDEGAIVTNLHTNDMIEEDVAYNSAIDGLESLILAHHCEGIEVDSPIYIKGIETAIDAIAQNA